MLFRRPLFELSVAVIVSIVLGFPALTQADTPRANAEATANAQRRQYDEALVERVIKGTPPFTKLTLAPGVHSISYYPAWTEEGVFSTPGGLIYITYELPLPPGAAAGVTMRNIGILNMGSIHPLAKPAYGAWKIAGFAGSAPIVQDQKQNLFALHGERLDSVAASFSYRPIEAEPNTCGTFADGSTCERGEAGSGVVAYAKSAAGTTRSVVTVAELDTALSGHAELKGVPVGAFNFDGRNYLNFDGAIFEIKGGALSIVGAGTQLAYTRKHIVLFDWHDTLHMLNEEEVP